MTSRTYALGAETNDTNADDESNFSHANVKLLPAEVLLDSVGQALGYSARFKGLPATLRTTQLPGVGAGGPFLRTFGKPERLLTCECERSESTTLAQAFQLINGQAIRSRLEADDNRIGKLLASGANDDAMAEELTLAVLNRRPTASEKAEILGHVGKSQGPPPSLGGRRLGSDQHQGISAAALRIDGRVALFLFVFLTNCGIHQRSRMAFRSMAEARYPSSSGYLMI